MKKKLVAQKDEGREIVAVSPEMSIPELARQLECGAIQPASVGKKKLVQCLVYFRSIGYSAEEISPILKISARTVQRRIKRMRSENAVDFGLDFQKDLMQDFVNNLRSRLQRLLRLSYGNDLTDHERARIIFMMHRVELEGLEFLEKLGYLSNDDAMFVATLERDEHLDKNAAYERYGNDMRQNTTMMKELFTASISAIKNLVAIQSAREKDLYSDV